MCGCAYVRAGVYQVLSEHLAMKSTYRPPPFFMLFMDVSMISDTSHLFRQLELAFCQKKKRRGGVQRGQAEGRDRVGEVWERLGMAEKQVVVRNGEKHGKGKGVDT